MTVNLADGKNAVRGGELKQRGVAGWHPRAGACSLHADACCGCSGLTQPMHRTSIRIRA